MDDNARKILRLPRPRTSVLWDGHLSHMVAGVSGGVVATLVLHPLDLVKIRFQVSEGSAGGHGNVVGAARPEYKGIVDAFRSIKQSQGMMGLYQGVTPNVWGAGLSWGLYFFFYNGVKTWMQEGNTQKPLGPLKNMLAASEAGLLTLFLTNPIWVTKTRMCLQYEGNSPKTNSNTYYKGMLDGLLKIYKLEGIRGLYRGFVPGIFGISHGALQFMAYEEMKTLFNQYLNRPIDYRLGTSEYLTFAALSKIFAATLTYPYQVVRSRLQDQHRSYNGVIDVLKQVWRYEGLAGFYKGCGVYMWHVTPNVMIVFLIMEKITNLKKTEESLENNWSSDD
ncbi:solute carrier family 25 member 32-like isoform X2 [Mytilus trossulus]|uniref:solute carrier family 25 member 32-like isoform X2 n=1 Tax=Mytilus trossulus TaxID=6551 RepID=UPI003007753F